MSPLNYPRPLTTGDDEFDESSSSMLFSPPPPADVCDSVQSLDPIVIQVNFTFIFLLSYCIYFRLIVGIVHHLEVIHKIMNRILIQRYMELQEVLNNVID